VSFDIPSDDVAKVDFGDKWLRYCLERSMAGEKRGAAELGEGEGRGKGAGDVKVFFVELASLTAEMV